MSKSRLSEIGARQALPDDSPQLGRFERAVPLRESKGPIGPFKATKIWNSLVEHVKSHVELKRRRYKMRHIDSCFTGTDAVDVVLHFLLNDRDTFSTDLSREKAVKVCQMLMQRKVFHSATERPGSDKAATFEDSSSKLYHITGPATELREPQEDRGDRENQEEEEESSSAPFDTTQDSDKFRILNHLEPAEEPSPFEDELLARPLRDLSLNTPVKASPLKAFDSKRESSECSGATALAQEPAGPSSYKPTRTLTEKEREEVWRETALTQLLTRLELSFLDGILSEDGRSADQKSVKKQRQRRHIIISNLIARSWHLPLTPGLPNGDSGTSDPLLVTAIECIEFLPNGESILNDPVFRRRGQEAKLWAKDIIVKHFQGLGESLLPQKYLEVHMAILNQLLSGAVDNTLSCLQLYMLMLPSSAREEIYRLLRFMRSLAADTSVILDPQVSNEMVVLSLLSDCIFHHKLLAPNVARKLVQFMMTNVNAVFIIPRVMREKVALRLYQMRTGDSLLACESSFCHRVSVQEFERQSKSCTEDAVVDLMNLVLDDTNISLKEKKQRLKQFQKSHPELYQQHFDGML